MKRFAWGLALVSCGGAVSTPGATDAGPAPTRDASAVRDAGPPPLRSAIFCGATSCSTVDSEGEPQFCCIERNRLGVEDRTCKGEPMPCEGHRIACDDSKDCAAGTVCCAEVVEGETPYLLTACRTSCITGVPRARVCGGTSECADCAPFTCRGLPTSRYCGRPEFCP